MTEFDLLNKTELTITGVSLTRADLGEIARVVGAVLQIERRDLLVTDFQNDTLGSKKSREDCLWRRSQHRYDR